MNNIDVENKVQTLNFYLKNHLIVTTYLQLNFKLRTQSLLDRLSRDLIYTVDGLMYHSVVMNTC